MTWSARLKLPRHLPVAGRRPIHFPPTGSQHPVFWNSWRGDSDCWNQDFYIDHFQPTHLPFATSTPGRPFTVVIQKGETCYCLARRYNVNPVDLTSANTACSGTLDPGTTITIPQSGSFPAERALKPHPTNYTVNSADETIYSIACIFGDADPNLIIAANGLVAPYTLSRGQVLYIP